MPGEWMNSRTTQSIYSDAILQKAEAIVAQNTYTTTNPNMNTASIANAGVVTAMAGWNQNQWGDPRFRNRSPIH